MSDANDDKRIAAIREAIRLERVLISDLSSQVSPDLKEMLRAASGWLNDAEAWLASEVLDHPPRSESEMARWLIFVEGILDRAVRQRKAVEAIVSKHGPDARLR